MDAADVSSGALMGRLPATRPPWLVVSMTCWPAGWAVGLTTRGGDLPVVGRGAGLLALKAAVGSA